MAQLHFTENFQTPLEFKTDLPSVNVIKIQKQSQSKKECSS